MMSSTDEAQLLSSEAEDETRFQHYFTYNKYTLQLVYNCAVEIQIHLLMYVHLSSCHQFLSVLEWFLSNANIICH